MLEELLGISMQKKKKKKYSVMNFFFKFLTSIPFFILSALFFFWLLFIAVACNDSGEGKKMKIKRKNDRKIRGYFSSWKKKVQNIFFVVSYKAS